MNDVSLIIRTWNCRDVLRECLAGLDRQTFRDFERIVVDSGSTDGTVETARTAGARVVCLPPGSFTYGDTLNRGFREAQGAVLGALSAHSVFLDPEALGRLVATFRAADERVAGVYGCPVYTDADAAAWPLDPTPVRMTADSFRRCCNTGLSNSCSLIRRDLWEAHPFPPERCEDQKWAAYFLERGYSTLQAPAVRYRYRLDRPWRYYVRKHRDDLLMLHRTWPDAEWPKSALTNGPKVRWRFWLIWNWLRLSRWKWDQLNDVQKWFAASELGLFEASSRVRGGRFWWAVAVLDLARTLLVPARTKGWFLPSEGWP